jgi:hypothetical protein
MMNNKLHSNVRFTRVTRCGIPKLRFTGTVEDWEEILNRCERLPYYGMKDWYEVLVPIVKEFINAVNNKFNPKFWREMYKLENSSGGPFISGWIVKLYPYLVDDKENPYLYKECSSRRGLTTRDIPSGLSSIDFIWKYCGVSRKMRLVVGAFGVHQDANTLSLSPAYGWVTLDRDLLETKFNQSIPRS